MSGESTSGGGERGLDGHVLSRVLAVYRDVLEKRRGHINAINVFPVSDADTGSNLFHTIAAMADAADDRADLSEVASALTDRALLAGRGASGLIMSQALAGLCSRLRSVSVAGGNELADALVLASRAAYEAVVDPVEGTMLTAARDAGVAARASADSGGGALTVATAARDEAWRSVARSPQLLPVLAQAGVVDGGAVGYALFLDVLQSHLDGESIPDRDLPPGPGPGPGAADLPAERFEIIAEIRHVADVAALRESAGGLGTSVGVAAASGSANVHIHCEDPQAVLRLLSEAGSLESLELTDLHSQVERSGEMSILIAPQVSDLEVLTSAGADRLLAPFDPGKLMQSLEGGETERVRIVVVGEAAAAVRETVDLSSIAAEIVAAATPAEAAQAIHGRSPT